jgi:hypothetical protein
VHVVGNRERVGARLQKNATSTAALPLMRPMKS